jgi:tetratricopeptide (TPR) repeat protein
MFPIENISVPGTAFFPLFNGSNDKLEGPERMTINFFTFGVFEFRRSARIVTVMAVFLLFGNHAVSAQSEEPLAAATLIFNRAQDAHEKGDLKQAVQLYEKAVAVFPEFPEAEFQRGSAYLALGDKRSAENSFRRAVELRPDWNIAMTSLGSVLLDLGEIGQALVILQKAVEADPQNSAALTALVDLRFRTGAPPDILKGLLMKVSVLTQKTAAIFSARAALEAALGQHEMAKESLKKALEIDPANRLALAQLGDLSLADGDIDRAREIVARLDTGQEAYPPLIILKASVLAFDGRFNEALAQLDNLKVRSAAADQLRQRITIARSSRPQDLETQLAANEHDTVILGRLCTLYRRADPAKALEYCRRASEREPGNVNHAVGFGAALVQAREFESAIGLLRKILQIAPDNATARANLASALFQLKRYPEAKAEFVWLTTVQPDSAGAYFFLAVVHDQLTEYVDAAANYQRYLKLADPVKNKTDIERVNLRLPQLQRLIKEGKGKKNT